MAYLGCWWRRPAEEKHDAVIYNINTLFYTIYYGIAFGGCILL
jgi:hypothetical protein